VTEVEWLTSGSPNLMLDHCWRGASARKKRLFGCACCYRAWHLLPDARCKTAVRVAERFADGDATAEALDTAHRSARAIIERFRVVNRRGPGTSAEESFLGTSACSGVAYSDPDSSRWTWNDIADTLLGAGSKWHAELDAICQIIRDVFGNPFRRTALDPAWLGSDVRALAAGIYAGRDFGAMPILADALQEAGCTSDEVLNHCRDPKHTHARGCWLVDQLLGKK
jgi:hypothetical protein